MASNIYDQVGELIKDAPEAFTGFGPSENYGRLSMVPYVRTWDANNKKFIFTLLKDFGEITDRNRQKLALVFEVDVAEFNPALTWTYSRRVIVEVNKKAEDGTVEKETDYSKTVLPSLIQEFGDKWATAVNGAYVMVIDEPSVDEPYQKKDRETGEPMFDDDGKPVMTRNNTIKFLKKFKNKEECLAAYKERFGGSNGSNPSIPETIIDTVKTMLDSMPEEKFRKDLSGIPPFNQYDTDDLIAVAKGEKPPF